MGQNSSKGQEQGASFSSAKDKPDTSNRRDSFATVGENDDDDNGDLFNSFLQGRQSRASRSSSSSSRRSISAKRRHGQPFHPPHRGTKFNFRDELVKFLHYEDVARLSTASKSFYLCFRHQPTQRLALCNGFASPLLKWKYICHKLNVRLWADLCCATLLHVFSRHSSFLAQNITCLCIAYFSSSLPLPSPNSCLW